MGHTAKIHSAAFSPDGSRLVSTSADRTVRQWDSAAGQEVEPPYDRHANEAYSAAYSPDGQWVASAGADRAIRVWRARGPARRGGPAWPHVARGRRGVHPGRPPPGLPQLPGDVGRGGRQHGAGLGRGPRATVPMLRGHTKGIYPVAYSPDGRWLASGSWDNTVRLWDTATGEPCAILPHPSFVPGVAFGPDGTWLVSASGDDDQLRIWDVATARVRKEIAFDDRAKLSATLSPTVSSDGTRVAATTVDPRSDKNRLAVFDIASSKSLFSADGSSLAYSPDGRWLAVLAPDEKTVLLLDARTHETTARFTGHENTRLQGRLQSRQPLARLVQSGSHRPPVEDRPDGWRVKVRHPLHPPPSTSTRPRAARTHRRCLRSRLPPRRHAPGHGRTRRGDLAVGPGAGRGGGAAARAQELRLVAGIQPRRRDAGVRLRGQHGSPVGYSALKTRYQARREAAALRGEAERLVERLWREKNDPAEVVEALRGDRSLSEALRHATMRAVLRRARPPDAASGHPHGPP